MEDLISRQAVIDACDQSINLFEAVDRIKELPPVNPQEPKTGHWIGKKKIGFRKWEDYIVPLKDGIVKSSCSCSECGEWLTASDEYYCYGNYCPNCGAKMVESEVEE